MTAREFINKLCSFYKEQAYEMIGGRKVNNVRVVEAIEYIKRLPQDYLEQFWMEVVSNFMPTSTVPFPTPANLSEIWNNMPDTKTSTYNDFEKDAIERGREMPVKAISDYIDDIRSRAEFTNNDCNFVSVWEPVSTMYGLMTDNKMDMDRVLAYCGKLKSLILDGKKVNIYRACEQMFGGKKPIMSMEEIRHG